MTQLAARTTTHLDRRSNPTADFTLTGAPRSIDDDARRLVDDWLAGRNDRTRRAYAQSVRDFAAFIGAGSADEAAAELLRGGHGPANAVALRYRNHMTDRGLAPATINSRLAALRSVVALAQRIGLIGWSLSVDGLKAEAYRDTTGPARGTLAAMLERLKERAEMLTGKRRAMALRDRAIVHLLHDCGLRRGEVVALNMADIDDDRRRVWIVGKGKTQRQAVTLPDSTARALGDWIDERGADAGPLLVNFDPASKGDGRLSGDSIARIVKRAAKAVGAEGVRPHGLRHRGITTALDVTGGDVRAVARFSRHANIQTVVIYDDARLDLGGAVAAKIAL